MNITELTPRQLKRAPAIKEKLDALDRELRNLLNGSSPNGAASGKKRMMSAGSEKENYGRPGGVNVKPDIRSVTAHCTCPSPSVF